MKNNIQELKNDVTSSEVKVSELLRRAKILAGELRDKKFLKWVEDEMNGYSSKQPPQYRLVTGEPKGFNPYRGWVPVMFTNDRRAQETISQRRLGQSVSELENLVTTNEGSLEIIYPPEAQKTLAGALGMETQFAMFFSSSQIIAILDTVRNKILDWLIEIGMSQKPSSSSSDKNIEIIFPEELIAKLPQDVKLLADDFNFNFSNDRPKTSMLILRRMLPLSIVRRYQKDNNETEIKDVNGEYLDTKALLGKAKSLLTQNRTYTDLAPYKVLIDGAQHSYTLNVYMPDVRGAGIALRVFFDDIF